MTKLPSNLSTHQNKKTVSRSSLIYLISTLTLLSALPLDVMLPSFPGLAKQFNTDIKNVALSISVFAIGFSIAQLFIGPLSDRYGRKLFLLIGLVFATLGAAACLIAPNYTWFLFFRVIQSLGCACFVLAQAIIQDVFKGSDGINVRIFTTTFGGICIACSPLLGTILEAGLGWRGSFLLFIALAGLCLLQTHSSFHDTHDKTTGNAIFYIHAYLKIFKNVPFVLYTLIGALAFSCHFAFIIISPLIFIAKLKIHVYEYAFILLIYGLAYLIGGTLAIRVAKKFRTHTQICIGLSLVMIAGVLMGVMNLSAITSNTVLFPMLLCTAGTILIRPASATEAMSLFDEIAGTAAAAASTCRFITGGLLSAVISLIGGDTVVNLYTMLILSSVISALAMCYLNRNSPPSQIS